MPRYYFEDFTAGKVYEFGSRTVTKEEIVEFARQFDPQPFHLDEEAAHNTIYGGLIASGWHTCSICMRLAVDGLLKDCDTLGSGGLDELRWIKPLRPGDTVAARLRVLESIPSKSKPDLGKVAVTFELINQRSELIMDFSEKILFRRRPAQC